MSLAYVLLCNMGVMVTATTKTIIMTLSQPWEKLLR